MLGFGMKCKFGVCVLTLGARVMMCGNRCIVFASAKLHSVFGTWLNVKSNKCGYKYMINNWIFYCCHTSADMSLGVLVDAKIYNYISWDVGVCWCMLVYIDIRTTMCKIRICIL